MFEVRHADDSRWHVAIDDRGVYIRTSMQGPAQVVRTQDAVAIARAILEVADVHL